MREMIRKTGADREGGIDTSKIEQALAEYNQACRDRFAVELQKMKQTVEQTKEEISEKLSNV